MRFKNVVAAASNIIFLGLLQLRSRKPKLSCSFICIKNKQLSSYFRKAITFLQYQLRFLGLASNETYYYLES